MRLSPAWVRPGVCRGVVPSGHTRIERTYFAQRSSCAAHRESPAAAVMAEGGKEGLGALSRNPYHERSTTVDTGSGYRRVRDSCP